MSKVYSRRIFLQLLAGTIATTAYAIPRGTCVGPGGWLGPPGFCADDNINNIGTPGGVGFGVAVCPYNSTYLASKGIYELPGTRIPGHDNYGNYITASGSYIVWNPFGWLRIGHVDNPTYATYGVNSFDIKPEFYFASEAEANAAGYSLPRAFIDGGTVQRGFFIDKYKCSKQAWGTGYIAGSVKDGLPISTGADHNPIADLTACSANAYYETLNAAKARDGVNGEMNVASIWHEVSVFQRIWLAIVEMAHGQAATGTDYCAWYDAGGTTNFSKGCNNNALSDANDDTVKWESDGYSNCGKTGSAGYGGGAGNVFAKSTHNGQNCGVADVNGLMREPVIGMTCISSLFAIEAITAAATPVFTITGRGLNVGDIIHLDYITQADWNNFSGRLWKVATTPSADTFTLETAPDASGYAAYDAVTDGGIAFIGTWYAAKQATAMRDFTSGVTLATDHWGATGVAAMMDAIAPSWRTDYPNNSITSKYGNGNEQVLSGATSGAGWLLDGLGIPLADGASSSGTNLFGNDSLNRYFVNTCFRMTGGAWNQSTSAGVWASYFGNARAASADAVGVRLACYIV